MDMKIISGSSNRSLAEKIVAKLETELIDVDIKSFNDGELYVSIDENIRNKDVYIIQSTSKPINDNIIELLLLLDAVKRSSVKTITVVLPYFGYARQDRRDVSRTPISAKLLANIISSAGADRFLTLDLHAPQIQAYFETETDHIYPTKMFVKKIQESHIKDSNDYVIVAPDIGAAKKARVFAKKLDCSIAIIDKKREQAGVSEVMNIIGEVRGKICVLVDDIIDTGGTIVNASRALKENGATDVLCCITHGVLSLDAVEKIEKSSIDMMYISDSIEQPETVLSAKKIEVVSISEILSDAIRRINNGESILKLYNN